MGQQVAMMLANPSVHELIKLDSNYNIIEFPAKDSWVGKNIAAVDFRYNYDLNIIAIQHENSNQFTIEFGPETIIQPNDFFIGITTDKGMRKLV